MQQNGLRVCMWQHHESPPALLNRWLVLSQAMAVPGPPAKRGSGHAAAGIAITPKQNTASVTKTPQRCWRDGCVDVMSPNKIQALECQEACSGHQSCSAIRGIQTPLPPLGGDSACFHTAYGLTVSSY
jgi:hypothetical protein